MIILGKPLSLQITILNTDNSLLYAYQILLSNMNTFLKWVYIWLIYETLTGTTNLDQSGHGSNGSEGIPHTPRSPTLLLNAVLCYTQDTPF